ncbi:MAG: iron-containing alcohol dehydrogenase, partial [Erysipelotrichaceae bacterium]|nr:iron-containing alcohol dehydrogenase [Erysipelotrichaceae bacterium]
MIQDYVQYNPSKIIFGKGAENNVAEEIKSHGGTRVLIHFDAGDFITPLIKKIHTQLEEAGLTVFELGGVVPNPKVSLMKEGCKLVRENDVDFILAVGGGSTMDSSKYIACGAYYEGDIWDHPKYQPITTKIVKHGVIVTMPG